MRILQISDTHLGITTEGQIKVMLRNASKEEFDIIVHCGDYCGGFMGNKKLKPTLRQIRKFFPDKPFLSVIGNHDWWCHGKMVKRPSAFDPDFSVKVMSKAGPDNFFDNYEKIVAAFKEFNVHFLDKDGIYSHPDHPEVVFTGASGWYAHPNPYTNDHKWLPIGLEGNTNNWLLKNTEADLHRNEDQLKATGFDKTKQKLVFVSHFPVVNAGRDYKGAFEDFSWSAAICDYYQEEYGCKHFLCGHAHQLHKGPLRYECGPDYRFPAYQIVEV